MSRALKSLAVVLVLAAAALAQNLAAFEKQVTVKTLSNGLTAIVCRRPDTAPVFSFYTNVDAGSVQDPMGKTGLAHMFEHMAFKGTETIGTTNWTEEKRALEAIEIAYDRLEAEQNKGPKADPAKAAAVAALYGYPQNPSTTIRTMSRCGKTQTSMPST